MIYKLVDSASFFHDDEPIARIVEPGKELPLVKSAAHSLIQEFVDNLVSKEDKFYLHINAMGAGEYYGSNKNGDYFPEEQLIKYHKTFEEHGYVYRHHINKDPARSMGKVIFAIYNEDMHRVELIAEVSKEIGKDVLSRIEQGDFPFTSMACKTPYDVCSICGNKAHTRSEYCHHLTGELNKIYPDGKRVMALNIGPLKFFDISVVVRPADITSSVLSKVASEVEEVISSADMATIEGLPIDVYEAIEKRASAVAPSVNMLKEATVKKMAEIIKNIDDGIVVGVEESAQAIIDKIVDPNVSIIKKLLKLGGYNQVMNAFAEEGVSPSIPFLVELMLTAQGHPEAEGSADVVRALMRKVNFNDIPEDAYKAMMEITSEAANPFLKKVVRDHMAASSLSKVAYYWEQVVGPKRNSLPTHEPKPAPSLEDIIKQRESSYINMLITLIGAAMISKFTLAKLQAMKQDQDKNQLKSTYGNFGVPPMHKAAAVVVTDLMEQAALSELLNMRK